MSDPRDRSIDPLESELRAWFTAAGTPAAPASLHAALARLGAEPPATSRVHVVVSGWRTISSGRLAAVASALVVVAATIGLLLVVGQQGPAALTGSPGLGPSHSASPAPVASRPTSTAAAPSSIDDGGISGGTCSADQFVLGEASTDYGFGALGTAVVFVTQPLRNVGGSCVLELPETIGVAAATGPFHSVPVRNAGTSTSWKIESGQSLSIVMGDSWWVGIRDGNGTSLRSAPPCADAVSDVTRVEFPLPSDSIAIDLGTTWKVVCSSPASASLTVTD